MTTIYDLPEANNQALARSKALTRCIQQEIDKHQGSISFATFMELALYHPTLGYYNAETFTLGKHGDFTTAPEISSLFTKCFARQITQIRPQISIYQILELGAGTGRFAKDLLDELNKQNCLPTHYFIYEISPVLRQQQQAFFQTHSPAYFKLITWLDQLPTEFTGIMIANEVLDAIPTHCFYLSPHAVQERCIEWKNNAFNWIMSTPTSTLLNEQACVLRDSYALQSGYSSEINLNMQNYVQQLAQILSQGIILFADYGYGQREYYHPERKQGTLTCFYKHRHHDNPLLLPGLQDITTHVDFTRVIEIAAEAGCTLAGYTSQSAFLLACGLLDFAAEEEKNANETVLLELHQAIKLLTLPTEMGERIKFMALSKYLDIPLLGFQFQDRRRDL
jgi:SAM-dependent MidA family methyltransferase